MSIRIGRHVNISQGFANVPTYAKNIGCDIFQIFLGAPQRIIFKSRQKDEVILFKNNLEKEDMVMVVHGSYTINLCHNPKTPKYNASVNSLVQDLITASYIGDRCLGVIIHMGKNIKENNLSIEVAFNNYIYGLKQALSITPANTNIILETGASQGSEIASRITGLAYIYWLLDNQERDRVFFCIDTCHIWATGYDISTRIGVRNFFKEFDEHIGIDKIKCIHFNDSRTDLESHVDRHADLGYGRINEKGLSSVAKYAKRYNIPLIMETPLCAVDPKTNTEISFDDELNKVRSWL